MFDEAFGMTAMCTGKFREGVRDTFGASIVADVLDPILKEVDSLRILNATFKQQAFAIDRTLNDARELQFKDSGWNQ
ncbi:hypothetical protein R6U49_30355 [Pseudomonas aeruginosa]|uniref:hypothetical protein n=1 Tax=Pseudomonas aeruginosa TaxID=287 RepID=UPI00053D3648|nr:hypothetical protein [Pseudomonas aeruginosa]EKW6222728.1 hypothetical protein [Pseudomonas aeruginosa]ELC0888607.1 hypothetical protein [Pseudomonas aeruginosa]MCV0301452.1 hypothetical protein [Pseudomonas aeruginosa]MCV0363330.1 hypothetical protein [Pseudomonas aeruginosa]MCW5331513.1 hypothetical protein [Pseudomonas aeruginosa]